MSAIDFDTCTVETLRDELARLTGWRFGSERWWSTPSKHPATYTDQIGQAHPIPWTLDAIAAMMPEGWKWNWIANYKDGVWQARAEAPTRHYHCADAPTELEARARCVAKVLRHTKETP